MRILLVHNYYQQRGGEDVYFDSLVDLLKSKGHAVQTYTKRSDSIQTVTDKIQTVLELFSKNESAFKKILLSFKPDIVHFNNITPLISPHTISLCKKLNIPTIQTIHVYRYMCPKGILFREGKICELCVLKKIQYPSVQYGCYHNSRIASFFFMLSNLFHSWPKKQIDEFDAFIFPTEFTKEYYTRIFPQTRKKGVVISHSVELKQTSIINIQQQGYFLFVGRLSEEKGIVELVHVFKQLPDLRLLIIGDGPLKEQIEKIKSNNIELKGYISPGEKYAYLKNALFTIIPSLIYEQGPLVLFESFANGTPVIVPRKATFIEHVTENVDGLFFPYKKWNSLKKTIRKASQYEDINRLRKNTRKTFRKFTQDKYYQNIMNVYNTLVHAKNA